MIRPFRFALWIAVLLVLSVPPALALKTYVTGNTRDISTVSSQALCLAGGGNDDLWGAGWKYLLQQSGGGDVVIIRADGNRGGYESWIYYDQGGHGFPKVNSVRTLSLSKASDANLAEVETAILNAELVFFAGGDQSLYISWFHGSRLAAAVDYVMKVKKVPVGGTSAGMALLAGIDYTAKYSSPSKKGAMVTTEDVLKDPTGAFVDLSRSVLIPPFMKDVVTDTHFSQRNRQGRLFGFMARAVYNNYGDVSSGSVKGIGADEGAAVCFNETGAARVYGSGNVFFLKGNAPIERIVSGSSLDWYASRQAVSVYLIKGSASSTSGFDLNTWSGFGGNSHFWWVDGRSSSLPVFGVD